MPLKIGRNDPCACGSGKKYKQCCLLKISESVSAEKSHEGVIEKAVAWLMSRHKTAVTNAIQDMLYDELSNEQQDNLEALDDEAWHGIQLNSTEWLIAEGEILVKDELRSVAGLLLESSGLLLTAGQRRWIQQLSERPMRLYDVTDVIPGQQMTLCDALDQSAAPIIVIEKSGSQASLLGMQLGVRIMEVDGHKELSGGVYSFSRFAGSALLAEIRRAEGEFDLMPEDFPRFISFLIRRKWLEQYINPVVLPTLLDQQSGEPILFISDHYLVKDWDALSQALSTKKDVDGDRSSGWSRLKKSGSSIIAL